MNPLQKYTKSTPMIYIRIAIFFQSTDIKVIQGFRKTKISPA